MDTNPGYVYMSGYTIKDHRNYGVLDVTGIITKSSNVGISKLALRAGAGAHVGYLHAVRLWRSHRHRLSG